MANQLPQKRTIDDGSKDSKPAAEPSPMQLDNSKDALELEDSISSVGSNTPSLSDSQDSSAFEDSYQDTDMLNQEEERPMKQPRTAQKYEQDGYLYTYPGYVIEWEYFCPVSYWHYISHTERIN